MMSEAQKRQGKLFYHGVDLDSRVGPKHSLRRMAEVLDFSFVRPEVARFYGVKGNVSVDPIVIMKLMLLLYYENVDSERQLLEQLPLRLDWLWFCEYDIDDETPHHSVLSKARKRWGMAVFDSLFTQVLERCIDAGLVDGSIIHIDASLIDANASKDKLRPELRRLTESICEKLDDPEEENEPEDVRDDDSGNREPLGQRVSPVDPDARLAKKYGKTTLGYKDHRVVDDSHGIITATITTPANINDDKVLPEAVAAHQARTQADKVTAVADRAYGTIENYKHLKENGNNACIPHQRKAHRKNKFAQEAFHYDREVDCYVCPAGHKLTIARYVNSSQAHEYRCPRDTCQRCQFFSNCVTSKTYGRTISRNVDTEYIEWADSSFSREHRKRLLGRRRTKAEGSFADAANNHGFKRSRWRGQTMATIQNLIIAAMQNLRKLLRYTKPKAVPNAISMAATGTNPPQNSRTSRWIQCFGLSWTKMSKYSLFQRTIVEISTN
jgi:transposase